jgi:hypothetical protein
MNGTILWLDDLRPAPEGWVWVKTAKEVINQLACHEFEVVSLDHDLGDDELLGTGLDVLHWIEEQVALHGFKPPELRVHSMKPVDRMNMFACIEAIGRWSQRN